MPYPYVPQATRTRFYVPKTLGSDFTEFLDNDIPGAVMSFELLKDWYDQFLQDYEKTYIRGEIYPDSTKSRYTNTDNNLNFRGAVDSGIKKGDMVIDPENNIYLFDWEVPTSPNNRQTRALRCNMKTTFIRYHNDIVDDDGYLVQEAGYGSIAQDIPCNGYRYDGRPEFSVVSNAPGVSPNALTIISVQYNDKTKDIRIDDKFVWGTSTYIIIDVDYMGVNMDATSGVIRLQARKEPGGAL